MCIASRDFLSIYNIFLPLCDIYDKPDRDRSSLEARTSRSMTPGIYEATIGIPGHLRHTYVYDTRIRGCSVAIVA